MAKPVDADPTNNVPPVLIKTSSTNYINGNGDKFYEQIIRQNIHIVLCLSCTKNIAIRTNFYIHKSLIPDQFLKRDDNYVKKLDLRILTPFTQVSSGALYTKNKFQTYADPYYMIVDQDSNGEDVNDMKSIKLGDEEYTVISYDKIKDRLNLGATYRGLDFQSSKFIDPTTKDNTYNLVRQQVINEGIDLTEARVVDGKVVNQGKETDQYVVMSVLQLIPAINLSGYTKEITPTFENMTLDERYKILKEQEKNRTVTLTKLSAQTDFIGISEKDISAAVINYRKAQGNGIYSYLNDGNVVTQENNLKVITEEDGYYLIGNKEKNPDFVMECIMAPCYLALVSCVNQTGR